MLVSVEDYDPELILTRGIPVLGLYDICVCETSKRGLYDCIVSEIVGFDTDYHPRRLQGMYSDIVYSALLYASEYKLSPNRVKVVLNAPIDDVAVDSVILRKVQPLVEPFPASVTNPLAGPLTDDVQQLERKLRPLRKKWESYKLCREQLRSLPTTLLLSICGFLGCIGYAGEENKEANINSIMYYLNGAQGMVVVDTADKSVDLVAVYTEQDGVRLIHQLEIEPRNTNDTILQLLRTFADGDVYVRLYDASCFIQNVITSSGANIALEPDKYIYEHKVTKDDLKQIAESRIR